MPPRTLFALCCFAAGVGLAYFSLRTPAPPQKGPVDEPSRAQQLGLPDELKLEVTAFHTVDGLEADIAQFETVFWESADTDSLRAWLAEHPPAGQRVLEIGSGSGLLSLLCLSAGAEEVVATDINPVAVANTVYNAELLGFSERLDARWVAQDRPAAFELLAGERFDLIVSNPPWEDGQPEEYADFAYFDTDFALLESLLAGLADHLRPQGRCLLAYGCKQAIQETQKLAVRYQLTVDILDSRALDALPENFLPGMLLEVTVTP